MITAGPVWLAASPGLARLLGDTSLAPEPVTKASKPTTEALIEALAVSLAGLLRVRAKDLDPEVVLPALGLDSVAAAEFQATIVELHGLELEMAFLAGATLREVALRISHAVSERVYEARVVVGATNVPNVLDVNRLKPGSVLIDDSAPHCFDVAQAALRLQQQGDLVVSEGGLVRSPTVLSHRVFLPKRARQGAELLITRTLRQQAFAEDQIMGCVLSSALSAGSLALPCSVGPVIAGDALAHYHALRALHFAAPVPQCDSLRFPRS